jgi:hypothetical protein
MLIKIIARVLLYYFLYRVIKNIFFTKKSSPVAKKSNPSSGPVINAQYRVLSDKD